MWQTLHASWKAALPNSATWNLHPASEDLRRAVNRAQRVCEAEERHAQAEVELARLQSQAEIDLQRLGLWSGPLETLEKLPLPAAETIDRFEAEFAELDAEIRTLGREQADLQSRALELDSQTERLRLSQDAFTEDDLTAARQRREAGWRLVKKRLARRRLRRRTAAGVPRRVPAGRGLGSGLRPERRTGRHGG